MLKYNPSSILMNEVKISIVSQDCSFTVEGTPSSVQDYVRSDPVLRRVFERIDTPPATTLKSNTAEPEVHPATLDHAWEWFSLHAGQRLEAVNFYLVAAAFLSNAYVSALSASSFLVAIGVGLLGAFFAFNFFMLEQRVRTLVRAGEAALLISQSHLARDSHIPDIEILSRVDSPGKWTWSYSRVFRHLYLFTGIGFLLGSLYSLSRWESSVSARTEFSFVLGVVSALSLLVTGCWLVRFTGKELPFSYWIRTRQITLLCIGLICILMASALLIYTVYSLYNI